MFCLLTQLMSCLKTQQMSCLQTQQMSCLQTQQVWGLCKADLLGTIFESLDLLKVDLLGKDFGRF